jgi:hypothetical protein
VAHDLDPCRVFTPDGELIADGFVREHEGETLLVEAERFTGGWLEAGEDAVVQVLSSVRGECTYDAVVGFAAARRIQLSGLVLRERVQKRAAVRVPTELPHRITHVEGSEGPEALDEPLDVVVLDVSAHGLRFRCRSEIEVGARLLLTFTAARRPLDLLLEVVRHQELRTENAYGCLIVEASDRVTDELFRFVMDEQRRGLAERRDAR